MGVLNFANTVNAVIGADDANHVDGYVRKSGNTQFIFPVGDNGHYGPFAAFADGTAGAYYFANPATAVTSLVSGGNYPALPAGGPFPITTIGSGLANVSKIEYWDIDGANSTSLTLTWNANSAIAALTGSSLAKLIIAGWDGKQWVAIPSSADATSVLGGTSDLSTGSITTTGPIVPDTYTAYTLGTRSSALPVKLLTFTVVKEGNSARLDWSTTEETSTRDFIIERSKDAKNWTRIGQKSAAGESEALLNYDFTDTAPFSDVNYYRLKMTDLDDTFSYSNIRSVKVESITAYFLSVYPNPASDVIFLKDAAGVPVGGERIKEISVLNVNGLTALKYHSFSNAGVNIGGLTNGIYIVKIVGADGGVSSHKILVKK